MSANKIITLIVSIVLVGIAVFLAIWIPTNYSKLQQGISGTGLYTKEDLENAYEDGYNTALTNEAEYEALINGYRDNILNLNDTIAQLNKNIIDFQTQVATLAAGNNDKLTTIGSLNAQIEILQNSVSNLTSQVSSLTVSVSKLTGDNLELNTMLANLQMQSSMFTVTIAQLNSLVTYLSGIIIDWEQRTEFVVTYYVNGSIWDMQVISNPAIRPTLPTTPSGNWTFIGWSLDGVTVIDPTQINVVTDLNFKAVINTTATFIVDDTTYDTQTIPYGNIANTPTTPIKMTHNFVGWSINGATAVDIGIIQLTHNMTFIALWAIKTYTVSFVSFGTTVNTQTINHGSYVNITNPTAENYIFDGWTVGGIVVNLENTAITADTIFTARFIVNMDGMYKFRVIQDGVFLDIGTAVVVNNVITSLTMDYTFYSLVDIHFAYNDLSLAFTDSMQVYTQSLGNITLNLVTKPGTMSVFYSLVEHQHCVIDPAYPNNVADIRFGIYITNGGWGNFFHAIKVS